MLPALNSPNKSVISKRLGIISRSHFYNTSQKGKHPRMPLDIVKNVVDFYHREDITTTYPNKSKSGKPIQIMKFSRLRTFNIFRSELSDAKISITTFNKLKPRQIKLSRCAKYFQCLCDICDNFSMIYKAIKSSFNRAGVVMSIELETELALAKHTVCSFANLNCLDRSAKNCSVVSNKLRPLFNDWLVDDDHQKVSYLKWERVLELIKGKQVLKMKKVPRSEYRWEVFSELVMQMEKYPLHVKNACAQLHAYKQCKLSLGCDEAIVVRDFAENYVCRQFAEAQNAYYTRNSVTIHPMVVLFSTSQNVARDAVIMISDDLKHDSCAVKMFVKVLADHIKSKHPHISKLAFWSDGCGAQYKSRQPMHNIASAFDTGFEITWNFYGSRHCKSEADGEAAVVKNALDRRVKSEQLTLNDGRDCFNLLNSSDLTCPQTNGSLRHFYYVDSPLIECERQAATQVCAIPQVRTVHQVQSIPDQLAIYHRRLSCYCDAERCVHGANPWKLFKYPGREYIRYAFSPIPFYTFQCYF